MAYFSNSTEGEIYQAATCRHCVHHATEDGCPVWHLQLSDNYDAANNAGHFLNFLIPQKDGQNGECTMFHAAVPGRCRKTADLFAEVS